MKCSSFYAFCLAGLFVLLFIGCKKRSEYEVPCCIVEVYGYYNDPVGNVYRITYNYAGDPDNATADNTTTGRPNYAFKYDSKRRLTSLTSYYPDSYLGYFNTYTKYIYDNNNFVVKDTTYYAGSPSDPSGTSYSFWVTEYAYDAKGRISLAAVTYNFAPGAPIVTHYDYDASGNLIIPGVTYDNKINFNRTNLVWAFINRNYSMNNASFVATYNSKGLPTTWASNYPQFLWQNISRVVYSCDGSNHSHFD